MKAIKMTPIERIVESICRDFRSEEMNRYKFRTSILKNTERKIKSIRKRIDLTFNQFKRCDDCIGVLCECEHFHHQYREFVRDLLFNLACPETWGITKRKVNYNIFDKIKVVNRVIFSDRRITPEYSTKDQFLCECKYHLSMSHLFNDCKEIGCDNEIYVNNHCEYHL